MMRRTAPGLLLAAAALLAVPTRAPAQCRLCATPETAPQAQDDSADIALDIDTRLDFDRLVVWGSSGGTAELRADGSSSVTGAVGDVSGRAMVATASVHGEANRFVRIELPRSIELYSISGARVTLDQLNSDLPSAPRLDSAGNLTFHFGGRLRVSGEVEGDFRGDVAVTVEYL